VSHGTQLFIEAVKREADVDRRGARGVSRALATLTSGKRIAVLICEGEVFL